MRRLLFVSLFALAVTLGRGAMAEEQPDLPIDVDVPSNLLVGQDRPFIKLTATETVKNVSVIIKRSGKKTVRFRAKSLSKGSTKTFRWNEKAGIYEYGVTVQATYGSFTCQRAFTWPLSYLPPIKMALTKSQVDMATRQITFKLNHPADHAEVTVYGAGGSVLGTHREELAGARPNAKLTAGWPDVKGTITRIELTAHSVAGYWVGMELVPWAVEIPHEEVVFETDRWEIRSSERPKLDAAIKLVHKAIREHQNELSVNLYVAGFTDTVGAKQHNRGLSNSRAKAIGGYFAAQGVKLPIFYRGFGEEALAVPTADNVDSPENRRAVYVLGTQPPTLSKKVGWGGWKRL